jgi:hypothetical protein
MNINIIDILTKYLNGIEYKIISKNFKKCIEKKHKKAIKIIEDWYLNFSKIKFISRSDVLIKKKCDLVRLYNYKYPIKYLLGFPECITTKCSLSNNLLIGLNYNVTDRKRSDVIKWLQKNEITMDNILIAGW